MTRHSMSRGFSLIELLVVMAIIGVLTSVTLATLSVARAKGADAAVKADLDTVRKEAALYFDDNGDYGDDAANCSSGMFTQNTIVMALAHATSTGGGDATCFSDDGDVAAGYATTWAVSVPLKTNAAQSWCVDSAEFVDIGVATAPDASNGYVAECN